MPATKIRRANKAEWNIEPESGKSANFPTESGNATDSAAIVLKMKLSFRVPLINF